MKIDGDSLSFRGNVQKLAGQKQQEKVMVRYYMQTEEEKNRWTDAAVPSHLLINGELKVPSTNYNFNQFNYQDYLKRNKIHWQLQATSIESLEELNLKKSFFNQIDQIRNHILRYMDQTFHEKVASYLKILFLADGGALTEEVKDSYRALGIIHLFSISGFHISYLAKALERLFLRVGITHERTKLLLVVLLPFYGLLAGFGISVFRAVCQRTLLLWSTILDKELDSLDAWSMTMIFALILNPNNLFELAFQLSYGLSGLFILMGQREWIKELDILKQTILLSFLSFLVSIPLLSYHFYEISWITIVMNLLFMPFFTFILFPGLAVLLMTSLFLSKTSLFLLLNRLFGILLIKIEVFLFKLTTTFDFSFVIGRLPQIILIILLICIVDFLKKIEQKNKPSLLLVLLILLSISWNRITPIGYVLLLDVGQGDSILIKEPWTRKITLIDTGGEIPWQEKEKWQEREQSFTIGKDIVVPSLKSLGISTIDRLYITHAHEDHMGEIEKIHEELKIKEIAASRCTFEDKAFRKKLTALQSSRMLEVNPKMQLAYPAKGTLALHPVADYQSKNDQSLVLYVKMGEDSWLFTGDMEEQAERDMIQEYPSLCIDYLKVGHHGSKTSSTETFIDHIEPKSAVISAGRNNRYGHPDAEVIERFDARAINTFSTANDGAIKVSYLKIPLINKWITKQETVK